MLYFAVRTRGFPRERREARRKRESFLRFCIQFLFFRSGFSLFFFFFIFDIVIDFEYVYIFFVCVGVTELILLQRRTGMTSRPHQCSLSKTLAKPSSLVLRELRLAVFSFIFLWVIIIIIIDPMMCLVNEKLWD